ncbi:MAG TPA: hypothetical protein VGM56_05120 [Byssovorax sp.]|jgi:hypothetical protein
MPSRTSVAFVTALALAAGCSDGAARLPAALTSASAPARSAPAPAALEPQIFASPRAAFEVALASKPRVVGIGEAHTQKAAGDVPTTARRFTQEILPALQGRASDLLVELMMPPKDCEKRTAEVRDAQAPVTQAQSASNQNDYVAMGEAARKLGVVPDLLRPTCADLAAVAGAGDDAIPRSLELIERLSVAQTKKVLARGDAASTSMVVLYGGAIHNDREPPEERRAWAYGPDVAALVSGRYVEIDLFSADTVGDDEVWKKLPWRARYDKSKLGASTVLFRLRDDAFVIVLPAAQR